ncbi:MULTISPECIES: YHYH protein [unclassified Okeania]|uniref:YHYH protein n=1 Tax=unclassified Okeania TaxID=2634635 RepID=UPI002580105B|nr:MULTISPECIES: YHYH protein [unclassified Okeania]
MQVKPVEVRYCNGTVRKAKSSYQLKEGDRQEIKDINPGGIYDGTYREDYEYVAELGDLDECNGMTINGVYGYFVTDSYP